jgi:hypothetical protein
MRIAYVILTCEKYFDTRVKWQKQTSLLNVKPEDIYYLGHKMDPDQRLYNWGASDEYNALPYKTLDFFKNLDLDYDYYVLIDDDTYVFHDRLQLALGQFSSNSLISMGYELDHIKYEYFVYFSGGAGTVLTHALYKEVKKYISTCVNPIIHYCSDICVGKWLIDIKKEVQKEGRVMTEIHNCNFHPEYYRQTDDISKAITFHHLKTREQYLELALYNYTQIIN